MKFLFINSFYPPRHYGGADIQVYQLANKLAELGHKCHVIYNEDAAELKNILQNNGRYVNRPTVYLHGLKHNHGKYATMYYYITGKYDPTINQIIDKYKFDVIHYHNVSFIGQNVIQYGNAIKLYTEHTNWLVCPRGTIMPDCNHKCTWCALKAGKGVQLWRYTNVLNNNLKELDCIIAPSQFVLQTLVDNSIKTQIQIIPNFAESPPYSPDGDNVERYYLYVGALEPQKGIIELIDFYNRYTITTQLYIIGSGSLDEQVKLLSTKNNYIACLGSENDRVALYAAYQNAQALIIPSIGAENAPLVALEAMSVGTPIIVSDVGGLPEIANKIDPKLVYHNDGELLDLLRNFDKSKYSDKAKQVCEQNYTIDRYIEQYLELIQSCSKSA